jgi:hypothetical protein
MILVGRLIDGTGELWPNQSYGYNAHKQTDDSSRLCEFLHSRLDDGLLRRAGLAAPSLATNCWCDRDFRPA